MIRKAGRILVGGSIALLATYGAFIIGDAWWRSEQLR